MKGTTFIKIVPLTGKSNQSKIPLLLLLDNNLYWMCVTSLNNLTSLLLVNTFFGHSLFFFENSAEQGGYFFVWYIYILTNCTKQYNNGTANTTTISTKNIISCTFILSPSILYNMLS